MAGHGARNGPPHGDEYTARGGTPATAGKPDGERQSERQGKQQNQGSESSLVYAGLSQLVDDREKGVHRMYDELGHESLF